MNRGRHLQKAALLRTNRRESVAARPAPGIAACEMTRLENGQNVVARGELGEDRPILRQVSESHPCTPVQWELRDVGRTDRHPPCAWLEQTRDHRSRYRFPGIHTP